MRKPIFTQHDLNTIRGHQSPPGDLVHADFADEVLLVTRDYPTLGIPKGTFIVTRRRSTVNDGEIAVVVIGAEYVLRRAPVTEGKVAGLVLGPLAKFTEATNG